MLKIVVPYRDREEHLELFKKLTPLAYPMLLKSNDVKIIIVEQANEKTFDICKLINIGYKLLSPYSICSCSNSRCRKNDSFIFWPIDHWIVGGYNDFDTPENKLKIFWPDLENRINIQMNYFSYNSYMTMGYKGFSCCPKLFDKLGGQPEGLKYCVGEDNLFTYRAIKIIGRENIIFQPVKCIHDSENSLVGESGHWVDTVPKENVSDWEVEAEKNSWENSLHDLEFNILETKDYDEYISHIKVDWQ